MLKQAVDIHQSAATILVGRMMVMLRLTRRASVDDSALDTSSRSDMLVYLMCGLKIFLALTALRERC